MSLIESDKDRNTEQHFTNHKQVYLPQARERIVAQTKLEVIRLTYSLILRKKPETVYFPQKAA